MKKTLLTLLAIISCTLIHADILLDDFESGDKGWNNVYCGGEITKNPDEKTGLNQSENVLYIIRSVGCVDWSGAICNFSADATKGYKYLHTHMYRNNTGMPNLKVNDNTGAGVSCDGNGLCDIEPLTTIVANEWQDVVFDISQYEATGISFVFFMVDRSDITADAKMWVDNIVLSNDATPRTEVIGNGSGSAGSGEIEHDGTYKLVWSDEFEGTALDTDLWTIETNGDGGGNDEIQYYCDRGVSVSGGSLHLTATKEDYGGRNCTSGRINSQGKVYFTYGKIEARIKMPKTANGLWPAFWMMGNDIDQVGWPKCGETDIVEMGHQSAFSAGTQERFFNGAMHWGQRWDATGDYARDYTSSYSLQDDYHIFTCIWTADKVSMYLDNSSTPYFEMSTTYSASTSAPGYYFNKPNYILFNLAIGGKFPGIDNIDGITALASGPRSMDVDWVRVYQKGDAGETLVVPNKKDATALYEAVESPSEIIRTEYFDLQGRQVRLAEGMHGLFIQRTSLSNGQTEIKKIIK